MTFSCADALLLPHDRSVLANSGPLSMARSYRLPVVVSDVGYVAESVRADGVGFVAAAGDASSFAARLSSLAELDEVASEALRARIDLAAHKYSFEATVKDYYRALEMAVGYAESASHC